MTVWTNLIPAGSAAVGGLITGGFTVWAQTVTHNRTYTRERAARHDDLMIRRFGIEQETLLALQDAVTDLHDIVERKYVEVNYKRPDGDSEFWRTYYKVMKFANRTLSRDVEEAVREYAIFVSTIALRIDPRESDIPDELAGEWDKAMVAIRNAIRQDPFERQTAYR